MKGTKVTHGANPVVDDLHHQADIASFKDVQFSGIGELNLILSAIAESALSSQSSKPTDS